MMRFGNALRKKAKRFMRDLRMLWEPFTERACPCRLQTISLVFYVRLERYQNVCKRLERFYAYYATSEYRTRRYLIANAHMN